LVEAAGSPQAYTIEFALERDTPTGQFDPTFGADGSGIVLTQIGTPGGSWGVQALALQADGAIVAKGAAHNGTAVVDVVARYLATHHRRLAWW
jgi:hypothetical protein